MKILFIGGTGLIGPHAIQEIYSDLPDSEINTVTRNGRSYFTERAFKADRNDSAELERIIEEVSPDYLIDMIPFTTQDASNTSSLVQRINPSMPVIVISSIDVYSAYAKIHRTEDVEYQQCPIAEDMALRTALGIEGQKYDKLNVERTYLNVLSNVTILRLPAIYGWPDKRRTSNYLDAMLDGHNEIEIPRQKADWKFSRCLHKNAAYAIFKVIEANQKGHHYYNVAEERPYSDLEWCKKIAVLCGWKGQIIVSDSPTEEFDFKQDFYVSTHKIRDEIGFIDKYSPDDGLAECIKHYAYDRLKIPYKQTY
ncbi:MAG: NAD-dependent epimerase/dehydratase family protein [Sneathiella sp.]|uniref:NAD-dependent epimerase/dehydratase family protein n=1 Tax=Sneathiella sp. TaxID=1964365 RepID=UPI0030032BEA